MNPEPQPRTFGIVIAAACAVVVFAVLVVIADAIGGA
jgi:hypothetical protein